MLNSGAGIDLFRVKNYYKKRNFADCADFDFGSSRHSGIRHLKRWTRNPVPLVHFRRNTVKRKNLGKRIAMSAFGVIICAVSVAIFKIAAFGVDPFQSFMAGLDVMVPIKFGTLYVITNAVLLLFALIFDRHYIGIATFINLFLLGYITQFSYDFLKTLIVDPSIPVRIACLVIGVVIICFGSAFYMTADLGVSTYDAIALIIVNTWKKGKFQYVRIITDLVCVLVGCSLFLISGGKLSEIPTIAGIGTIITAFFMGPLIEVFNVHIARPILNGKKTE